MNSVTDDIEIETADQSQNFIKKKLMKFTVISDEINQQNEMNDSLVNSDKHKEQLMQQKEEKKNKNKRRVRKK